MLLLKRQEYISRTQNIIGNAGIKLSKNKNIIKNARIGLRNTKTALEMHEYKLYVRKTGICLKNTKYLEYRN